ncbi:hypothetical protein [Actinacidiphila sp. ITFR-21]|uniref:hypothetical protein n=1 Tax=Actinacidiphila sp. ITFR-21 TaxID=3075199 RepID=UPI00288A2225|nr:hypothetical protein [Streptomyces sp. ITFR-21]WNI19936.1 hypothetical protein RLT57_30815 [Streptomyces sp. ITFR-21]
MTRPSETAAISAQQMVLQETLRLTVPLHIQELRCHTTDTLMAISTQSAAIVGSKGDILQFHGRRGETTEVFNALARGLAVAALLAYGGVDFLGIHWCADPGCQAGSRFHHAADAEPADLPEPPFEPPPQPITDLPDLAT